jgi:NAD(P)-dependent dehydrogenase (short-subunit alcohol dehydrogenase family)
MKSEFRDKVALVTGAAAGMGLATARTFAEAGAAVVLADFKADAVSSAAEALSADEHRAIAIQCDVSNEAQVASRRWSSAQSPNLVDSTRRSTTLA